MSKSYRNQLLRYAKLEGSELGEALHLLCRLHAYSDYLSPEINKSIREEIKEQLVLMKEHTKIVKHKYTTKSHYDELVWTFGEDDDSNGNSNGDSD